MTILSPNEFLKMSEKLVRKVKDVVDENIYIDERPNETNVLIRSGIKRIPLPANVMIFQAFAYMAATKLMPISNQILMLLFSHSAYENYVGMDVATISSELGKSTRSVLRALKELEDNQIIIRTAHPSDKRRNDYFINPTAAWRGNSFTRKKMMDAVQRQAGNSEQLKMFQIKE